MVDFRKAFAEKLNEFVIPSTTPQEDKSSMIKELDDLVLHNLPSSLYKYRSCNIRNIEALSRNVTYGVPVSYMNDPMDGLVYIDKNKIIADAKFGLSRGFVDLVKSTKCLPSSMDIYLDDDKRESILNAILNSSEEDIATIITQNQQSEEELIAFIDKFIDDKIKELRDVSLISSFSEIQYDNSMWAYYADNHSGFVIEYEPKSTRFDFCYNCSRYNPEKCKQQAVRGLLYPIIYQNERTDATMWLDAKLGELILKSTGLSDKVYNPDILFYDRICLTKDEKWAHEKEWRVVCYPERQCEVGKPIEMTTPTPKAIYYGVNILPENLSMLRSVVQALSSISPTPIKEYQMKINKFAKGFELTAELLQQ